MKRTLLLIVLTLLLVAACATSGPVLNSGCEWARPIYFDPADVVTERTEDAIIKHNEAGERNCGWKPAR